MYRISIVYRASYIIGAQGKSRSGTVCIAYLMWKNGILDYDRIYKAVKEKRNMVMPNLGFERQLKSLEWSQIVMERDGQNNA